MYFDRCDVISGHIEEHRVVSAERVNLTIEPTIARQSLDVRFSLPHTGSISLTLCDIAGRKKTDVLEGSFEKGIHTMTIVTSNLPAGVYFMTLRTPTRRETVKFIIAR